MSRTVGLSVTSRGTTALVLGRRRILWSGAIPRVEGRPLSEEISEILSMIPSDLRRRVRVRAAIGPWASQVKQLTGLPAVTDERLLEAVVRESSPRLFLRTGHPLATSSVEPISPGIVWAAAVDITVLTEIAEGCSSEGFTLHRAVPAAVAVFHVVPDETFEFRDGDVLVSLTRSESGRIERARRWRADEVDEAPSPLPVLPELQGVEGDPAEYMPAYGAAILPADEPLAIRPALEYRALRSTGRRLSAAGAFFVLALVAHQALPVIAVRHRAEEALERTTSFIPEVQAALSAERELLDVSEALMDHSRFLAERRSALEILASFAAALPPGSGLQSIHSDSLGATLVVLAPRVASVIPPLQEMPNVRSLAIASPVGRELVDEVELERVTLRIEIGHAASTTAEAKSEAQ